MTLPADTASCPGIGSDADGWYEECETCLRRTTSPTGEEMTPPQIIVFSCAFYVEPQRCPKTGDLFGE